MIAALLFINQKGEIVISRMYRDGFSRSLADTFRTQANPPPRPSNPRVLCLDAGRRGSSSAILLPPLTPPQPPPPRPALEVRPHLQHPSIPWGLPVPGLRSSLLPKFAVTGRKSSATRVRIATASSAAPAACAAAAPATGAAAPATHVSQTRHCTADQFAPASALASPARPP